MALETGQGEPFKLNSAATTNATLFKAGKCFVDNFACSNIGGAAAFVKVYDKASAPTVGTDVPVLTIPLAAAGVFNGGGAQLGWMFSLGFAVAITNLAADTDTTAVAAAQVKVFGTVCAE
jgi:hypothetical protein